MVARSGTGQYSFSHRLHFFPRGFYTGQWACTGIKSFNETAGQYIFYCLLLRSFIISITFLHLHDLLLPSTTFFLLSFITLNLMSFTPTFRSGPPESNRRKSGSRPETINQIAAVEDMRTKLYSMQTRHIARNLERPSVNRDIYPQIWSLIEAMEAGGDDEKGRPWWDQDVVWVAEKEK